MQTIPIKALASQTLNVVLGGQAVTLTIYQKSTGLYIDVLVNGAAIITGVICLHAVKIVRDAYLGFIGDLAFVDTQGEEEPDYTGLGARWALVYLEASEL